MRGREGSRGCGYQEVASYLRFHREQWMERNAIMVRNILEIAENFPRQRLVIVTGDEHRYILRDLLTDEEGITLREFWEVVE